MARTDLNTQDRQESAVGVFSAISACDCETVLDSKGYSCRLQLQATAVAARHSPTGCRSCGVRWALLEHDAGAIRLQELAGELLA